MSACSFAYRSLALQLRFGHNVLYGLKQVRDFLGLSIIPSPECVDLRHGRIVEEVSDFLFAVFVGRKCITIVPKEVWP